MCCLCSRGGGVSRHPVPAAHVRPVFCGFLRAPGRDPVQVPLRSESESEAEAAQGQVGSQRCASPIVLSFAPFLTAQHTYTSHDVD